MANRDRREWMDLEAYLNGQRPTFAGLLQGIELGGHCSSCERTAGIDRWEVAARVGKHRYIADLRPALRCMGCGNKGSNSWVFCMQAR